MVIEMHEKASIAAQSSLQTRLEALAAMEHKHIEMNNRQKRLCIFTYNATLTKKRKDNFKEQSIYKSLLALPLDVHKNYLHFKILPQRNNTSM